MSLGVLAGFWGGNLDIAPEYADYGPMRLGSGNGRRERPMGAPGGAAGGWFSGLRPERPRLEHRSVGRLQDLLPELRARTILMGVLNITPDSFSDGGEHASAGAALARAKAMLEEGADIIDVGGESTRPGAARVSASEELRRVLPAITALSQQTGAIISIDTTKAEVAAAALDAGAHIVNDVSAMRFDPQMPSLVGSAGAPVVLMHTRARPEVMQQGDLSYDGGVMPAVVDHLVRAADAAIAAGVDRSNIVLDPGIGFGKSVADNALLIDELAQLRALGFPVLVGTSRKSFLGKLTGRTVGDRVVPTAASVAIAIARGADIVRVHDVREMKAAAQVADAIVRPGSKLSQLASEPTDV